MKSIYERKIVGYECDIYGHLNNANYLHVYEEARTKALNEIGLSISGLLAQNLHMYLNEINIKFMRGVPLDSIVTVTTEIIVKNRLRSIWHQEMFDSDGNLCSVADVHGVFARDGRPIRIPQELMANFGLE